MERFYDIQEGEIMIAGHDIKEYSLHELREQISISFQAPRLFTGTVRENLLWGNPDATQEEIDTITKYAFMVNDFMVKFFKEKNVDLIDFKIEFGRYKGQIILADEISPDTCRFWDSTTHEKLDKDRFRRDMGGVEEAYQEMMKRLGIK